MTKFSGYSNQWGNEPWGALPGGQRVKGIVRRGRGQKTASEKFAPAALKHSENEASKGPPDVMHYVSRDPKNLKTVRRGGERTYNRDDKGRFA